MIPEVQRRIFAFIVSPDYSSVFHLLDFVGCSTAPAPLQDYLPQTDSDFAVAISKCWELLVLCRKKGSILLHQ